MPRNTPLQLGTYHMVQNAGFEPQRNNNFEVQIIDIGSLKSVDKGNSLPSNASDLITLSVASYAAPQINISAISVAYGNNKIKYAGVPEFPDSTIVLNDYIGVNIERILSAWQKLVYNPKTQAIGNAVDYKKVGYLLEFDPSGQQCRQWQLNGVWPTQLQLGDFNQEGNSVRQITMSLSYDHIIPLD